MDDYDNEKDCFLYDPEFSGFTRKILKTSDDRPLFVGVGFHSLMKKNASGGFVGQLGRDIAGVAIAGLPGLILAQSTGGSDFFGNIVILLYYKDSLSLVDLGYCPLNGYNYEEVTLAKNWQNALKNGEGEPKITTFLLEDIELDYDAYENYSLLIKQKETKNNGGLPKLPLKVTFPLSKSIHLNETPPFLRGTAAAREIVDQFWGTVGFLDPKIFIELLKTRISKIWSIDAEMPEDNMLKEYAKNEHFMHKFMDEYEKLSGMTKKEILHRVFSSFPDELKKAIHHHFVQRSQKQSRHSMVTKVMFFLGAGLTIVGLGAIPFIDFINGYAVEAGAKIVDEYTIPVLVICCGGLFLLPCLFTSEKVEITKWYSKNLKFSEQMSQKK